MTYDPYQDPSSQESIRKGWLDKFSGSQNVTLGPGSIPLPGESPMSSDKMSPPAGSFRRPMPMPPPGGGMTLRGPGFSGPMPGSSEPIQTIMPVPGQVARPINAGLDRMYQRFGGNMMNEEMLRRRIMMMRAMGGSRMGGMFGNMSGMTPNYQAQRPAIPGSFFGQISRMF